MRRVVVTGMGIVHRSATTQEVLASLREAKSGVMRADKYAELGFRCQVHGAPTLDASEPSIGAPCLPRAAPGTAWWRWSRRSATPGSSARSRMR